jgi:hypothetical protein
MCELDRTANRIFARQRRHQRPLRIEIPFWLPPSPLRVELFLQFLELSRQFGHGCRLLCHIRLRLGDGFVGCRSAEIGHSSVPKGTTKHLSRRRVINGRSFGWFQRNRAGALLPWIGGAWSFFGDRQLCLWRRGERGAAQSPPGHQAASGTGT